MDVGVECCVGDARVLEEAAFALVAQGKAARAKKNWAVAVALLI